MRLSVADLLVVEARARLCAASPCCIRRLFFNVFHPLFSGRGTVDAEIKVPFYWESRTIDATEVG